MNAREALLLEKVAEALKVAVAPDLAAMRDELHALRAEVSTLRAAAPGRKVKTMSDIVRDHGYSRKFVTRHPWLMPNFGRSDFDGQYKRWRPETYQSWYAVPADARRTQYDRMPPNERRKLAA
jgi:hypothetical protein